MSSFDFSAYLQANLRSVIGSRTATSGTNFSNPTFTVQILTGGLTNHTARITFAAALLHVLPRVLPLGVEGYSRTDEDILNQKTVILKHAPPYIAADPSQAMSVDRQLVEKLALELVNYRYVRTESSGSRLKLEGLFEDRLIQDEESSPSRSPGKISLHVPRLIWHDRERSVLWIEDLGSMRTLSEILLDEDDSTSANARLEETIKAHLKQVSWDLGTFLARLYCITSNPPQHILSSLPSSDPGAFHDYLANTVLENLKRPEAHISSQEAQLLVDKVRAGLRETADLTGKEVCLGMVDFWPESVLVDLDDHEFPRVGLVDWEYFGPSNAASELGMFLAHLHVHLLNSSTSARGKERITLFAEGVCQAYVASNRAISSGTSWKPSKAFKRRTLLSHGREMVNGVALYEQKLDPAAKKSVLAAGMRSLRAVGTSPDDLDMQILRAKDADGASVSDVDEYHYSTLEGIWQAFAALGFDS
ncbi:hypothetical protein CVT26_004574 [Gymnopilus dilepis]|uniref:Uncharacterized protein n=1 Tax=Gymnopilus dilepis TaxID=231916 RepID=A0A409YTY3_9AGAR|nr:hypothetical protein CVT26_004574 [Gymnopilus dilepis]